jgi:6-phosphofructo-2-kinase / fructose-2,6-biphosphatase 2
MELERHQNILIIGHQAILRCIYAYFMNYSHEDLPYIKIPLHTVIELTPKAYGCDEKRFKVDIEAVDTHRPKPSRATSIRKMASTNLASKAPGSLTIPNPAGASGEIVYDPMSPILPLTSPKLTSRPSLTVAPTIKDLKSTTSPPTSSLTGGVANLQLNDKGQ